MVTIWKTSDRAAESITPWLKRKKKTFGRSKILQQMVLVRLSWSDFFFSFLLGYTIVFGKEYRQSNVAVRIWNSGHSSHDGVTNMATADADPVPRSAPPENGKKEGSLHSPGRALISGISCNGSSAGGEPLALSQLLGGAEDRERERNASYR